MTQREDERPTVNPDDSPFETPAVEGLPFDDDSAEARAIREIVGKREPRRSFWRLLLEHHA